MASISVAKRLGQKLGQAAGVTASKARNLSVPAAQRARVLANQGRTLKHQGIPLGQKAGMGLRQNAMKAGQIAKAGARSSMDYGMDAWKGVQAAGVGKTMFRGAITGAAVGGASSVVTGDDFWDSAGRGAVYGAGINTISTGIKAAGVPSKEQVTRGFNNVKQGMTKSASTLTDTLKNSRMAQTLNGLNGHTKI
ncbi:hypothetical protein ACFC9N_10645 [Enterococcus casseliflavus]|uniref:hypothetical protein n=1 Tax=Enterococcus TaxID=1350 RepID=UPI000A3C413A|nr:hypothetical protein [Enterococcus sp. 4E1_DIV0656]OTO09125.1 hypothetical protein A5882_003455 [Enterococcus sp. 4E1_DIV0656]